MMLRRLAPLALLLIASPLAAQQVQCTQSRTTRTQSKGAQFVNGVLKSWYVSADSVATSCKGFPSARVDTITGPVVHDTVWVKDSLVPPRDTAVTPPADPQPTPPPPVDTTTPGSFATPDILANASFESGWDGFLSGSATTPNGAITRSTDRAVNGTTSVKVAWASGGELEAQAFYAIGNPTHFFTRYWYYLTALPNGTGFKFVRYQDGGYNHANGMQILNGKWVWVGNTTEAVAYTTTSPILNSWHYVEFEWDRATKQVRMWQDGVPMPGGATDAGLSWSGATLTYTSDIGPARLDLLRIINARTNAGAVYLDRIAVSTKRIGP